MTLTRKERVYRVLRHQPVDRLPTQVNYTQAMGEKLTAFLDVPVERLPDLLDNHLLRVDLAFPRCVSDDGRVAYDWWGVGWSTETEGYWPAESPLSRSDELDEHPWPDPHDPHLLDEARRAIADDGGQHFIVPNFGFCLFERAWSLRGFETFLMDLVLNPAFVGELLDRITDVQVALARRFVSLGVDGGYFGDDYGAQQGMLFSPKMWRAFFKPLLARIFAVFQEAGLPIILHSDGDIAAILPDLVEIGMAMLNPVQPEVLDHAWLKQTFGDQLAFYGGLSQQAVLSRGTPADVRAAVTECARTLAADGTGLLIGPSHRMTSEIPLENVDAMLAAFASLVQGGQ
jgi:uroporphyrinogen decarboxylase